MSFSAKLHCGLTKFKLYRERENWTVRKDLYLKACKFSSWKAQPHWPKVFGQKNTNTLFSVRFSFAFSTWLLTIAVKLQNILSLFVGHAALFFKQSLELSKHWAKVWVSGWGSSRRRSPRGNHISHTPRWNPVPIAPSRRWHPVSLSSDRRPSFSWNPVGL